MGSDIIILQRKKELELLGIGLEGWIYKNNLSNFILFLPFTGYYLINILKEKHNIFEKSIYIIFVGFHIAKNMFYILFL